jgi:HEAT repeats
MSKKTTTKGCFIALLGSLMFAIDALAYLGRPLNLEQLVANADIIAVVDVSSVQKLGQVAIEVDGNNVRAYSYISAARLERTIKGRCSDQISIESYTPVAFVGIPQITTGVQMVFLKPEKDGFVFADAHYPSFPSVSGSNPPASENVVQKVIAELGAVIGSPTEAVEKKWEVFRIAYAIPTSEAFTVALRNGLGVAADVDLRSRIEAELISRDDLSSLPTVEKGLLTNAFTDRAREAFLFVIAHDIRDDRAAPTLCKLLHADDRVVRKASAEGLWHIASSSSVPDLVRALGDADQDVRFYVVRALAEIERQPAWGPSEAEFGEHERKYIDHWVEWSRSAGTS